MQNKKKWIRVGAFLAVLGLCLFFLDRLLMFKYSDAVDYQGYYQLPENSVDVLLVGSSQMAINVSAPVLWEQQGEASYCLWGSIQPVWNTYYSIVEALKTQTPKVIVWEITSTRYDMEYSDYSRQIKNTIHMNWSENLLENTQASVEEEQWEDFMLKFPLYHTRYNELSEQDWKSAFELKQEFNLGTYFYNSLTSLTPNDITTVEGTKGLSEKNKTYVKKILELCKEKDIPLLLIKAPCALTEEDQQKFNTVKAMAEDYGFPFIDYNLIAGEIGFDYSCDMSDTSHASYTGAIKTSTHLATYLQENYDLTDHRGEKKYEQWEAFSKEALAPYQ